VAFYFYLCRFAALYILVMIRSMTGFGNAIGEFGNKTISVDIRSLNSKFFDLVLRVPSAYREKDMELRSLLSKDVERGKLEVFISIDSSEAPKKQVINKEVFRRYYLELKALSEEFNLPPTDYLGSIFRIPDALNMEEEHFDEDEWGQINGVLKQALTAFNKFRDIEGKSMEKELKERIDAIESNLREVEPLESGRI